MMELTKKIVSDAEKMAKTIVEEAKQKHQRLLKNTKQSLKVKLGDAKELAVAEGKKQADMETAKIRRNAKSELLIEKQKIFEELKVSVTNNLIKNPKTLFEKTLKAGQKEFKKPVIEAGNEFIPFLKKLKAPAKKVKNLVGMRIGENGVWFSADISEIVEDYFEENYSEILLELFGE